jgi:hypothetical protein
MTSGGPPPLPRRDRQRTCRCHAVSLPGQNRPPIALRGSKLDGRWDQVGFAQAARPSQPNVRTCSLRCSSPPRLHDPLECLRPPRTPARLVPWDQVIAELSWAAHGIQQGERGLPSRLGTLGNVSVPEGGTVSTEDGSASEVLHVVVGHGLPRLYLNALHSFRSVLPRAHLLVIDNASPQAALRRQLTELALTDANMDLVMRDKNEAANGKVGGLYTAYRLAFERAIEGRFRYVHLMQADMQLMWWDADTLRRAKQLFAQHPRCVNLSTMALSKDRWLGDELTTNPVTGHTTLTHYGLTDTGLYKLERWRRLGAAFADSEVEHAQRALRAGMEVVVFPSPTEIPVPWPAVIRKGKQRGREVRTKKAFLCKPLTPSDVNFLKAASHPVPLEEICIPWGWSCLAPMWNTDLDSINYWVFRHKDLARNGWPRGLPRWVTAGLDRRIDVFLTPHRPSLTALLLRPLVAHARERIARIRACR